MDCNRFGLVTAVGKLRSAWAMVGTKAIWYRWMGDHTPQLLLKVVARVLRSDDVPQIHPWSISVQLCHNGSVVYCSWH